MKNTHPIKPLIILAVIAGMSLISSCSRTSMPGSSGHGRKENRQKAAVLSEKLGFTVSPEKDDLRLYEEAASWLGTPYRNGGTTRNGVDCSGLVAAIYRDVYGTNIGRSVKDMYRNDKTEKIPKRRLRAGDLVFFWTGDRSQVSHVGIYLKDGYFIHSSSSKGVRIDNLSQDYYRKRLKKCSRTYHGFM